MPAPVSGRRPGRSAAAVAAGVASGVLMTLASPSVGLGWLGWVALSPAAAATFAWRGERAGLLPLPVAYAVHLETQLVPALPFGIAEGQWGNPPPVMLGGSPVVFVALVAVPLLALALYALRFGQPWLAESLPAGLRPIALVAVPAAAIAALDFLRVRFDPGGFWGPLFLSQQGGAGAELATAGGPWLLSFALAASGYAAGLALARARGSGGGAGPPPGRSLALAGAVPATTILLAGAIAVVPATGSTASGGGAGPEGDDASLTVAAVQPGYDTAADGKPALRRWRSGRHHLAALDMIEELGGMSARAAERGAELVLWPEASLFVDPREHREVLASLRRLAARIDAAVVVPYFVHGEDISAVIAVSPDGRVTSPRAKGRPMWFLGERSAPGAGDAAPKVMRRAVIGPLLGIDNEDTTLAAAQAGKGAELLASATHDWRGLAVQQRAFAAINARVTGRALVRADWRYGSLILDAGGDALADAGTNRRRALLVAEVALGSAGPRSISLAEPLGWAFVVLAALTGGAALARRVRRGRRALR